MSVILYARVSTGQQAEKELSIPAQINAMKRYALERKLVVAAVYEDVASGYSFGQRPGLVSALRQAAKDEAVSALLVHKVDRLSRNTYQYLTIKGQLRSHGVNIVSVVEHFEDSPMGEFIEHIMAAQAEFYSANLSFEVKKGMEERLRGGRWNGPLPVGYIKEGNRVRLDPARAEHIRYAFQRWATGTVTCAQIATELLERGLVGRNGKPVHEKKFSVILRNKFYIGVMKTKSGEYPGSHPFLVGQELFDRCQEIFLQKGSKGKPRKHLVFLLAGLLMCPKCESKLIGENHVNRYGKTYRYYRCHRKGCRFYMRGENFEQAVVDALLKMDLPKIFLPMLRTQVRLAKRKRNQRQIEEIKSLRERLRLLDAEQRELALKTARKEIDDEYFDEQIQQLHQSQRLVRWMLARCERTPANEPELLDKIALLQNLEGKLCDIDVVARKQAVNMLVATVHVGEVPKVALRDCWQVRKNKRFDTSTRYQNEGVEHGG